MPDAINTGSRREGAKILTSPCHNSGCGLSRFLDGVATRLFVEAGLQFAHHFFQLSEDGGVLVELLVHLPPALARGTPVHKHVLFPRVAMEVTEQEYLFGQDFSDVAHDTLGVVDGRMEDGVGSAPPPVQVVTRQPAPAYQKPGFILAHIFNHPFFLVPDDFKSIYLSHASANATKHNEYYNKD